MNQHTVATLITVFLFFQLTHTSDGSAAPVSPGSELTAAAEAADALSLSNEFTQWLLAINTAPDLEAINTAPDNEGTRARCTHIYTYTRVNGDLYTASNCKNCGQEHPSKGSPGRRGTLSSISSRIKGIKIATCLHCGTAQRRDNFSRHNPGGPTCERNRKKRLAQEQS